MPRKDNMTPTSTAAHRATTSPRPWIICSYISDNLPQDLSDDTQAAHIIRDNFIVLTCSLGSDEHRVLESLWPALSSYRYSVIDDSGIFSYPEFDDEKRFLQFLSAPKRYGTYDQNSSLYQFLSQFHNENVQESGWCALELKNYVHGSNLPSISKPEDSCVLSIKLIEGGSIQARFNATECLMDVKRWLQKELHFSLVPEDDVSVSRYTNIGHFKPSRYAFFYPATRKTFSEAQEFLKLKDLELCPRSALILRPDYDEVAMKAAREADSGSLMKFYSQITHLLQALYSFFDYGVDDASQESRVYSESPAANDMQPPHFLGSRGPVAPSASLLRIYEGDSFKQDFSESLNHDTPSQANGESFMNVGREEF